MKLRTKQFIVVEAEFADWKGEFTHDPSRIVQPMLLPGGHRTEHSVKAYMDMLKKDYGDVQWRARVIYRWRSQRHLFRWLRRGGTFKPREERA